MAAGTCPGFTLWPGSAPRLYAEALRLRLDGFAPDSEEATGRLRKLATQICADTNPVCCYGAAGTIVLWHRNCMHSVGANYSDVIRQAIIFDVLPACAAPLPAKTANADPALAVQMKPWRRQSWAGYVG